MPRSPYTASRSKRQRETGFVLTPEEMRRAEEKTGQKSPFVVYPKQAEAIARNEHIIGFGGGKFSGKTKGGIYWLISGNKHTDDCARYKGGRPCDCPYPDYDEEGRPIMVNRSYIYHPKFLGCVLRENVVDLRDWINEARSIYEPVGGVFKEGEKQFEWPSGATVFCGHYQEETAFTKYAGLNIVRFLVEEATHIPNVKKRIQMLRSCNRSVYKDKHNTMLAQMMLTFNPGGVSHGDILDMFVEPKDANGDIILPGTTITEEYNADEVYGRLGIVKPPEVGDKIVSKRVFILATIKDNPAAAGNQDYIAALMDMPEEEREAYLFANWRVLAGEYFRSFRPRGPLAGEPAEANHVVPHNLAMPTLQPWWWATAAMDYGYAHECAFGLAFHDQDRDQLWITEEFVTSQTEPDIIGEEVARRVKPVLKRYQEFGQDPMITMGLSHDAYGLRQDERSIAELIAKGMSRVMGPGLVHVPDLLVDKLKDQMEERGESAGTAEVDDMFERIRQQKRMGITIRRMRDSRIVGWQFVRSLMRWKNTLPGVRDIFDPNLASKLAYERGIEAYNAYLKVFEQKREILPKMQIVGPPAVCAKCQSAKISFTTDHMTLCAGCGHVCHVGQLRAVQGTGLGCSRLINAIPKAIRSDTDPEDITKKHVEGASDLWDMLRYLCMTFRSQTNPEPFEAIRRRRIADARTRNPNVDTAELIHLNRRLESDWQKRNAGGGSFHVVRPAGRMRARAKGLITAPSRE